MKPKYIIGIDEVGRGPLAGPVTVAAIAIRQNTKYKIQNTKLRDSKKLSEKQREIWFKFIKKNFKYAVASVSPRTIDKINISKAANLAATRALKRLLMKHRLPRKKIKIFLDGGLYINKFQITKSKCQTNYKIQTIIKGDEKVPAIALASIVAKVTRDKRMKKLHKKYPKYGFNKHKGYGTKKHIKAIKKHDLTDIHRKTFSKKFRMIK